MYNKKNKKGTFTLYIVWFILALFILILAAVIAPTGVRFNTELYRAGEKLMLDANETLQDIQNTTVRNNLRASMSDALAATENNITINTNIFRYSWLIILFITALVLFLSARKLVEVSGGRGGFI